MLGFTAVITATLVLVLTVAYANAMQADWQINANGFRGTLHINPNSGDQFVSGRFTGTVDYNDGKGTKIVGDLSPNMITIQRYLNSGARQDYVGYFFRHPDSPDVTTMAGYYYDTSNGKRSENHGFYATTS